MRSFLERMALLKYLRSTDRSEDILAPCTWQVSFWFFVICNSLGIIWEHLGKYFHN